MHDSDLEKDPTEDVLSHTDICLGTTTILCSSDYLISEEESSTSFQCQLLVFTIFSSKGKETSFVFRKRTWLRSKEFIYTRWMSSHLHFRGWQEKRAEILRTTQNTSCTKEFMSYTQDK